MTRGNRRVSSFMIPMLISNMAADIIAIKTGFKGPSYSPVLACVTSDQAIGEGFLIIKHGYTDAVIVGGAAINTFTFSGFTNMCAMSTNNEHPEQACRPFDKLRDGFVMSEGSGILFLEELEHAKSCGAKILEEIVGY